MESSRRAHSSVVEHRTAVPVVIGSNPIVPFFFLLVKECLSGIRDKNKHQSRIV